MPCDSKTTLGVRPELTVSSTFGREVFSFQYKGIQGCYKRDMPAARGQPPKHSASRRPTDSRANCGPTDSRYSRGPPPTSVHYYGTVLPGWGGPCHSVTRHECVHVTLSASAQQGGAACQALVAGPHCRPVAPACHTSVRASLAVD